MDTLRSLDWHVVHALATYTGTHVWVALAVMIIAELFILIPFVSLLVLWRRPEPISHRHGNQKAALLAVMTMVLALAIKALLNFLINRPRPYITHIDLAHLPLHVDSASFPSGHTLITFAIAFSLWHSGLHKLATWLLIISSLIAVSRVAAGVHYPSDILGGIVVAFVASLYLHREASSIKRYLPNQ